MPAQPGHRLPPVLSTCPRCAGLFGCGVEGEGPCACTTLSLPADTQAVLRRAWVGCLCLACLLEVARHPERAAMPRQREPGPADSTR